MNELSALGWTETWARRFEPFARQGLFPGRVCAEHREQYHYASAQGEGRAVVTGRLRYGASGRGDFPAVGDWVALQSGDARTAVIHAVVERANKFSRTVPGGPSEEQIVAANLDTLFLVTSLNRDFNPRRIERYLAAVSAQRVRPVILLTKSDLTEHPEEAVAQVQRLCPDVPAHAVSALTGDGVEGLRPYLGPGSTVALVGSSGVGKSTLLNRLLGADWQEVQAIREDDDRGRHTTTRREMLRLPDGGLVIDNPGMRELQLWDDDADLDATFADVSDFAARCRFPDCTHAHEPGCAVQAALADGTLDAGRFENYLKLQRELAYLETRRDPQADRQRKEEWKRIHRIQKKLYRQREKH